MTPSVAVCMVGLPDRFELQAEAIASVHDQTFQPDHLLIGIDYARVGEVANMNRLIDACDSEWLAFLHDDDVWLPQHLEMAMMYQDADVIVSKFHLVGRPSIEPQHDNFDDLRVTNWFPPSSVVARRSVFGHWTEPERPPPHDWVDWSNWRRLLDQGARFTHTNQATMQYRFGEWNRGRSWSG